MFTGIFIFIALLKDIIPVFFYPYLLSNGFQKLILSPLFPLGFFHYRSQDSIYNQDTTSCMTNELTQLAI